MHRRTAAPVPCCAPHSALFLLRHLEQLRSIDLESGKDLGELDQVADGVAEEGEPTADGGHDEGLGDDLDAAAAKLGDRLVHARDVEAEVVVAAVLQAVAEIRVWSYLDGQRVPSAEYLDVEIVVRRRRQVGKLLVGVVPLRDDAEVELADMELFRFRQARSTHRHMMASHVSEGRGAVFGGRGEISHVTPCRARSAERSEPDDRSADDVAGPQELEILVDLFARDG